jgi:hypothetical protein
MVDLIYTSRRQRAGAAFGYAKYALPLLVGRSTPLRRRPVLSVDQFREHLLNGRQDFLIDEVLLAAECAHVTEDNRTHIANTLAEAFRVDRTLPVDVWIVGSAKLGFSTSEKRREGRVFPRYRAFSAYSDIDVAVISKSIFDLIWHELSEHSHRSLWFPWNSKKLGDYLVCGWVRPDHFPNGVRLRHCDTWWDTFSHLSRDRRFGPRKVRGGLFADIGHLRRYLQRAIKECEQAEKLRV